MHKALRDYLPEKVRVFAIRDDGRIVDFSILKNYKFQAVCVHKKYWPEGDMFEENGGKACKSCITRHTKERIMEFRHNAGAHRKTGSYRKIKRHQIDLIRVWRNLPPLRNGDATERGSRKVMTARG